MKKETLAILNKFKDGKIDLDSAQRKLFVLFGVSKNANCILDRLKKDCSVFLCTKGGCENCGQFIKN